MGTTSEIRLGAKIQLRFVFAYRQESLCIFHTQPEAQGFTAGVRARPFYSSDRDGVRQRAARRRAMLTAKSGGLR
jgi:hypothetical protein